MDVIQSQERRKMGLLEDIGETIGNALSALAEFIGDAGNSAMRGLFTGVTSLGADVLKTAITEIGGSDSDIALNAKILQDEVDKKLELEIGPAIETALDYTGPVSLEDIETIVPLLREVIDDHLTDSRVLALIVEAVSMGQIDGMQNLVQNEDSLKALTALSSSIYLARYDAALMTPYKRLLNAKYPNKIPGTSDMVLFGLREAFDPEREKILLKPDAPDDFYTYMKEQGYSRYWAQKYWASHWVLPSIGQLNEMLHRRIITSDQWESYVRYNDVIKEAWPWLKAISYNPYTRVDTRRMWDLRLLTEDELKSNYLDLGYDETHADKMTIWTKVYVLATELRARFNKGWITEAEVRTALTEAGMPADRVSEYMEKILKADKAERVAAERDLTKTDITRSVKKGLLTKEEGISRLVDLGYDEDEATMIMDSTIKESIGAEIEVDRDLSKADIIKGMSLGYFDRPTGTAMLMKLGYTLEEADYIIDIRVPPLAPVKLKEERDLTKSEIVKGVKKEVITELQGEQMLQDLGYDAYEAGFILAIHLEALAGSPETWSEMQAIVNKERKALGRTVKEIPKDVLATEKDIKKIQAERVKAVEAKKPRQDIVNIDKRLKPLELHHKKLVEAYVKGE